METEEQLMQWLRKHYNDFEMAFLIALAVFEKSPYLWVYEMAEELFALFEIGEEERQKKQKEKEKMPGILDFHFTFQRESAILDG